MVVCSSNLMVFFNFPTSQSCRHLWAWGINRLIEPGTFVCFCFKSCSRDRLVADWYPFPFSNIKDWLPFRSCLVDILEGGSLITRVWRPLWKLPHKAGHDQWELADKERAVVTHTQTEEHCYCRHLGYLFSHWEKKRKRSSGRMFWILWRSLWVSTGHRGNLIYQSKLGIWSSCRNSPVWLSQSYCRYC